ncbi:hypothetical protein TNCV_1433241 [Trichonephila clavipes]|nr:hypothetical protein TNCV_1433241 [Trichonephila clavipes]
MLVQVHTDITPLHIKCTLCSSFVKRPRWCHQLNIPRNQHADPSRGRGSQVVKVSDSGWHVPSSNPVPLKTRRVGEGCRLNLSRAQRSSRWCGVVVRRGGASSNITLINFQLVPNQ